MTNHAPITQPPRPQTNHDQSRQSRTGAITLDPLFREGASAPPTPHRTPDQTTRPPNNRTRTLPSASVAIREDDARGAIVVVGPGTRRVCSDLRFRGARSPLAHGREVSHD